MHTTPPGCPTDFKVVPHRPEAYAYVEHKHSAETMPEEEGTSSEEEGRTNS